MARNLYIERALFIVGEPNSGKSTQIRSMFLDHRLGLKGEIPKALKIPEIYSISPERWLYIRLTSPHEYGESPEEFFEKIQRKMQKGRWSIISPLQPGKRKKMPDVVETVRKFTERFAPERVRICFLSPDKDGNEHQAMIRSLIDILWQIEGVECAVLDARSKTKNALVYTDFLDFS